MGNFAQHCGIGLFDLKLYLLDNLVEKFPMFGRPYVLDGFRLKIMRCTLMNYILEPIKT